MIQNLLLDVLKTYFKKRKKEVSYEREIKGSIYFIGLELIKKNNGEQEVNNLINKFKSLNKMYKSIKKQNLKLETKLTEILDSSLKKELKEVLLGELYEKMLSSETKKKLGIVYTPREEVKYILKKIDEEKVRLNPNIKILDPACGGGFFLIEAVHRIKEILILNEENLKSKYENIYKNIDVFIIENMIFGVDIDEFAVFMTTVSLMMFNEKIVVSNLNILNKDMLYYNKKIKYDFIIGNPPYIGHKKISKEKKQELREIYNEVYTDKGDISYCFFQKSWQLLKNDGKLIFITSRYFMESKSGFSLRKYIEENFKIKSIIDFNGRKLFNGIGISPVILELIKRKENENYKIKVKRCNSKNKSKIVRLNQEVNFEEFCIEKNNLQLKNWVIINNTEYNILRQIELKGEYVLRDLCESYQGIITGLDSAFVLDVETVNQKNIEKNILYKWIKNSDINSYDLRNPRGYIAYTDLIDNIEDYQNIEKHLKEYKDRLLKRRECKKGIRKWYQLQWGRSLEDFKPPKILFPYKASKNRFSIDYDLTLFSADIYMLKLKKNADINYRTMVGYLNSKVFEFYIKTMAKRVGTNLYDYYPNNIMNLKIAKIPKELKTLIENNVKEIEEKMKCNVELSSINELIEQIDKSIYEFYEFDQSQINAMESFISL